MDLEVEVVVFRLLFSRFKGAGSVQVWTLTPGPRARMVANASPSEKVTTSGSWGERALCGPALVLGMK